MHCMYCTARPGGSTMESKLYENDKDNVNDNVQEVSDLRAKIESLELEKIELERKNTDRLQTENPDENQNILIESAQDIGDIKYTILGKYPLKFLTCKRIEIPVVSPKV